MIKKYRTACGYTQFELAEKLGVKQTTVAMWENGTNKPRSSMLPKIAAALNCTIDELFAQDADECNGGENK